MITILLSTNLFPKIPEAPDEPVVESLSSSSHIIPLHGLSQETIPTGCESVSTVAILNHLGIKITPEKFINNYLPQKSFYRSDGVLYGPDPNEYFAGDPFSKSSLGCFPNVILKALKNMQENNYPNTQNLSFQNVSGTSLSALSENYILNDIPVLIWATMYMKESKEGMTYYLEDSSLYTWRSQEHCVVLCGYNEANYYIMDPLADGEIIGYPKELVEKRYEEMEKSAVLVYKN